MPPFDQYKYRPTIDAILSVADLEQVSVKRIRRALQELFVVDFEQLDQKKDINDLVLERYHYLMDVREQEAIRERKKMEEQDARLAAKLQDQGERAARRRAGSAAAETKAVKKKKTASSSPRATSISSLELNLSPKLQELLGGQTKLPRTQVVKQVWDYIKANNLQNPNDKREIICDEKMQEIFGKKTTMFSMNKQLSQHLYKDDE